MLGLNQLVTVCVVYVAFLFAIAFWAERRAQRGALGWLRSPMVYTLSISVYCTAWTFYGAVGSAARNGLEFVAIYLGPTLVFIGWWWLLRKLLRVGQAQRITSIADLISSRYGKSAMLGVAVTLLAVVSSTPYIALQLQSITVSFSVFAEADTGSRLSDPAVTSFWVAAGLALFTVLFGTRNVDANERHHGVVTAIALEALVKLAALLAVGIFVVWGIGEGPRGIFARMPPDMVQIEQIFGPRWLTLMFLSATAVLCLPRMFQVTIVENSDERHLATASWAFPAYLFMISLFVLPIAIAGQYLLPTANPDLYVLTVPLQMGQENLALLAFLGGFSSATSMVIVAAIALSTMVSNHIVMPLWLRYAPGGTETSGDVRSVLLTSRRISIGGILLLGYLYFRLTGGSDALASIGLISFAGAAQVLPSLLGAIFWRGANRAGALAGLAAGFLLWAYTLFLPSFGGAFLVTPGTIENGLFGLSFLRPYALFGLEGYDPLVHSIFWSLGFNALLFVAVSMIAPPRQLERLQAAQFVDVYRVSSATTGGLLRRFATSEDLFMLAQRILGTTPAHELFTDAAERQGKASGLPDPTDDFIDMLERELSGSVGAASAHAMVSQIAGRGTVSVDELMMMADETAQAMEYSAQLERQSRELAETASQLRAANAKLTELSAQKDAFLSQVSHELRTPMTSIRSFSEILQSDPEIAPEQATRFAGIIHDESIRLTRLLDEILDLSFLESGRVQHKLETIDMGKVIERALYSTEALCRGSGVQVSKIGFDAPILVHGDFDRLAQVFINLISNAVKYGGAESPQITIRARTSDDAVLIDVIDNGRGIQPKDRDLVFEKFSRLSAASLAGSAGLGLTISREIIRNFKGELTVEENAPGAVLRVRLPLAVDQVSGAVNP